MLLGAGLKAGEEGLEMTRAGGDMYDWIGETRNPLGGACPHGCPYCYVRRMRAPQTLAKYSGPPVLVEREVERSVRGGRSLFVCSCNDLFAAGVPGSAVGRILGWASRQARLREGLVFVFQTKNPRGYLPWLREMPPGAVLGVTIESDEWLGAFMGSAPSPSARALAFAEVPCNFRRFVSIEPIMACNPWDLAGWMRFIHPDFVSIGADSGDNGLPEPSADAVRLLVDAIREFGIEVRCKANLERIVGAVGLARLREA